MKESFVQGVFLPGIRMQKVYPILSLAKKIVFSCLIFLLGFSAKMQGQTVVLTSNNNPACAGSSVILTATVTPNPGAGVVVTFLDGALPLGTANTNLSGIATFTPPIFTTGNHLLTTNTPSVSPVLTQVVFGAPAVTPTPSPVCTERDGTITVTPPAPGLFYSIDGIDYSNTTGIFLLVKAGTYNVTVKNASNCISPATTVTLNLPNGLPPAPTVTPTQPTCAVATGTITVNTPAPGGGNTYSIDGSTYTNNTGVFNNIAPGVYNVTVKNAAL
ncbi:MAG TPA: Ig-like domain-containing protein, partial [Flavitalea sp.]|nr:Ig-like domain-containing protein [Flavitalea sp.]